MSKEKAIPLFRDTVAREVAAAAQDTANKAMPKTGDIFTGNVIAYETARTTRGIFNNETRAGSTTGTLQSVKYFIDVT